MAVFNKFNKMKQIAMAVLAVLAINPMGTTAAPQNIGGALGNILAPSGGASSEGGKGEAQRLQTAAADTGKVTADGTSVTGELVAVLASGSGDTVSAAANQLSGGH